MNGAFFQSANHGEGTPGHQRVLRAFSLIIVTVFLMALLSVSPPPATGHVEQAPATPPLVVLNHTVGNFFVLSSDFPFAVEKAEPEIDWLEVELVEGESTAHRTVALQGRPKGLSDGDYYSAIRVHFFTPESADDILIPVVLRVGDHVTDDGMTGPVLAELTPDQHVRLQTDAPTIDIRFRMTPGRHYIIEIVDKNREQETVRQLSGSARAEMGVFDQTWQADKGSYAIVFPWVGPACCGDATEDHMADVEANLDAVNMVCYEKYGIIGGTLKILNPGGPGLRASQVGLGTWPMVSGNYFSTAADIEAMWDQRDNIASKLIEEAEINGYRGYCIDVEGSADTEMMRTFTAFVDYLAEELHVQGYQLMVVHATWSTIAPIDELAMTSVDYVVTMDPCTSRWYDDMPADYVAIEPDRLIWAFTWETISAETQEHMWQWMEVEGYNTGVAGAAAWHTPLMWPHPGNNVDYYQGFRDYYPLQLPCTMSVSVGHWKGEYYDNKDLQGKPSLIRDDGAGFLNFDWDLGSPTSLYAVGVDQFSVRWTRTVVFEEGIYRFTAISDDGFRLFIDGEKKMAHWVDRAVASNTVDVRLLAGKHKICLEYYENSGYATAGLFWEKISDFLCSVEVPEGRWKGEYYDPGGQGINILRMVWDDGDGFLNFDWGLGSPSRACGIGADGFFVRWTRTVVFEEGTYRFTVTSDDGFRLYVDGAKKMEYWADRAAASNTVEVALWAGKHIIELEYYENRGCAVAGLRWENLAGPDPGTDCAQFAEDINVPDGTVVQGGEKFRKGWRVKNCGDTTWRWDDGEYLAIRVDGTMSPIYFYVPVVAPGETGELWADIYAPTTPGTYRTTYQMEGPNGYFGDRFWVEIVVKPKPTNDCSTFIEDLTYPDGAPVSKGETFRKGWRLSNCGDTTWSAADDYRAVRVSGNYGPSSFDIPTVGPGKSGKLYVDITAPSTIGTHRATYRLEGPRGVFGTSFWVEIKVSSWVPE